MRPKLALVHARGQLGPGSWPSARAAAEERARAWRQRRARADRLRAALRDNALALVILGALVLNGAVAAWLHGWEEPGPGWHLALAAISASAALLTALAILAAFWLDARRRR